MKRVLRHILFWLCYIAFCMFSDYLWAKRMFSDMSPGELFRNIMLIPIFGSIPEILFTYYLLYIGFERLFRKSIPVLLRFLEITAALATSIFFIRMSAHFILQYAYKGKFADEIIFDPSSVLRSIIYLGFISGFALSIKLIRRQLASKEREKKLVQEKLSTELKLLRNQLNPHFLFNTLNNIYALARKKSDLAPDAVMKLSELLSFMLYEAGRGSIAVTREIAFVEDYISLEKIRYNDRLSINVIKKLSNPEKEIAPLILLPLVENAFKHGISETRFSSYINIYIKQEQEHFNFKIENSYESEIRVNGNEKIGLKNIRRQLELTYGAYNIDVSHDNQVFEVALYLNLDSYGKV